MEVPCEVKIKALKFLAQAYGRENEYEDIDFDSEEYRKLCSHDFKVDNAKNYEQKLLKSIGSFSREIPSKSREKFIRDKANTKQKIIMNIINSREGQRPAKK